MDYIALKYNPGLPRILSFYLVAHLPKLIDWGRITTASDTLYSQTHRHYVNLWVDTGGCKAIISTIFKKCGVKINLAGQEEGYILKVQLVFHCLTTKLNKWKTTYLFCGAFTNEAVMFWSIKNRRDRQNPSPMAPNTLPIVRELKSANLNIEAPWELWSKLLPTE